MSRLRANIFANIAGQAWFVLVSILCTPFLIKLLGVEAYGLIAFYALLQNLMQILDMGMGATVNREIARSWKSDDKNNSGLARFVVTMERWYWVLGSAVGLGLFLATPYIVTVWLRPEQLSVEEMAQSARLIGILACLQWPLAFYQNGLLAMQRQVALNAFQVVFGSLSTIGGVVFVWLGPRSIASLLVWQVVVMLLQLLPMAGYFWTRVALPKSQLRFDLKALRGKWGFSLGMSGIAITGSVLTHLDKVILSRLLTLEYFGYYTLAGTMARGLYVFITPVFNAYFPRFSALVASGDTAALRISYHRAAQVMSVLILPVATTVAFFSREIASLWLRNLQVADEVAPIATILVIGTCLNGLMNIPFALQLAYGRTRIGLYINAFLVLLLIPAIIFSTLQYGATGGAAMWATVNAIYLLIGIPVTHKYLLTGATGEWLRRDLLPPMIISIAIVGFSHLFTPALQSVALSLTLLAFVWVITTLSGAASAGHVRNWGRGIFINFTRRR
jgi:O-antigen/teichoic acid export membrane protein